MATRISNPIHQHFTKGSTARCPLSRGQLFFYEPGTTTKKTVYSNQDASTAYSDNPIALDDSGFEPDIFGSGSYRVILKSSVDTNSRIQWDEDPVVFSNDEGAFGPWLDTKTYGAGKDNIITGPDDKYYISIQASNLDNIPASSATYWTEFDLLKQWNTNESYSADDPVTYLGGYYTSITSSNSGNTPSSSTANWRSSDADSSYAPWLSSTTYGAGGENIVTGSDGKYYISIQGSNLNQDPNAGGAPTYWTEIDLLRQWNTNETYITDDPVTSSGSYYISLADSNTGNTPDTTPAKWRRMSAKVTVQKFTVDGTWTKPAGVKQIIVEVIGGGGGSGSDQDSGSGGGGGYARITLDASGLTSETVTVGDGGAAGAISHNNGSSGESSSFGTLCVATGGGGGFADNNSTAAVAGGVGTTGDMLANGGHGGAAKDGSDNRADAGGSSAFGAGGAETSGPADIDALPGRPYGGGAGGCSKEGRNGGAGANGFVIVTEFF